VPSSVNAVDALDREPIRIDYVHDPVWADTQAVVLPAMETFGGVWVGAQRCRRGNDSAHPVLIFHIPAR
jgi:hypothetical protein